MMSNQLNNVGGQWVLSQQTISASGSDTQVQFNDGVPTGTSLLTCNTNSFKDFSTNNFTVTPVGNTVVSSSSPFTSSWSNYFDGNGDYLSTPASSAYDFGTGDFTIETWVYIAGNSSPDGGGNRIATIISAHNGVLLPSAGSQGWDLIIGGNASTTGTSLVFENFAAGAYTSTGPSFSIPQLIWNHIAMTRQSGVVRFFLNGVQQGANASFTSNVSGGAANCWVGALNYSGFIRYLNGYLSNLRVVKGTALYTGNFTPQTTPFATSTVFDASSALTYNKVTDTLVTTVVSASAMSGSLTKLSDGTNFLRAGSNVTLVTGSNGSVTVSTTTLPSISTYTSASSIVTNESTTSSTYVDLATVGPTVTMTTGTSVVCHMFANVVATAGSGGAAISVAVSGATTVAASDSPGANGGGWATVSAAAAFNYVMAGAVIFTGLTPGVNTFTLKYRVAGITGLFKGRRLVVQRLN
jgi:hypothetical protein